MQVNILIEASDDKLAAILAVLGSDVEVVTTAPKAAKKPRRPRRKPPIQGGAGEPELPLPEPAAPTAEELTAPASPEPLPGDGPSAPVTAEEVRKKFAEYVGRTSTDAALDLLKQFGAARFSNLDPAKYEDFYMAMFDDGSA
jgi:hypothetical protein